MRAPILLVLATLLATAPARPCGPYPYLIRFWNDWQPDDRAAYLGGELGTLGARYGVTELWVAYRHLEGLAVDPRCCAQPETTTWVPSPLDAWRTARSRIQPPGPSYIDQVRLQELVDERGNRRFEAWDNCLPDAFATAAATLDERIATHGLDDRAVHEWVEGQDQVFANCGGGETIPAGPEGDWPPWLRADREYQIAAAHLYSRGYDQAEQGFRRIAADPTSPWRQTAHYVVARALSRAGKLEAAIAHLRTLLADPSYQSWHPAAQRLLAHLRHRHEPEVVLGELAARLSAPAAPSDPTQDLLDLGRLLRAGFTSEDPLVLFLRAAWVGDLDSVKRAAADAAGRPDSRWWLAAALGHARAVVEDDPWSHPQWPAEARADVVAALLGHVPPAEGPAALALRYHHLRLLAAAGRLVEGSDSLEGLVAAPLSPSDRNRVLTLWRELAHDLPTYLDRSLMVPVQHGWWYGEGGGFLDPNDESSADLALLDPAAAGRIDDASPKELRALAGRPKLPPQVAKQLLSVALTRSILSKDLAAAADTALELRPLAPELEPQLAALLAAAPERQDFLGLVLLLEAPGLEPILHGGLGRGSRPTILPLDEIENFGANWWCGSPAVDTAPWAAALTQHAPLAIGREVLAWADAHRDDPDVPRALARLVRATRFACGRGVGAFAEVSRGAFERLHQRYPKSEWTSRTPYWYE